MRTTLLLILGLTLILPIQVFAGLITNPNTDIIELASDNTQLTSYYDLRDRETHIQVTNFANRPITIHVQIFQHDRGCTELNFDDALTPNDTVVYNLDDIFRNNGTEVPINLDDNSYGYVVVSLTSDNNTSGGPPALIGNFRIIDNSGYEYRSNMMTPWKQIDLDIDAVTLIANFNTVDDAKYTDVVAYAYDRRSVTTVRNISNGISFDIFVFDMNEEPLSCDRRNFACGNVMNYGINEDYINSRDDNLLCPGGALADPQGGFVAFENGANLQGTPPGSEANTTDVFVGLIGINNNNGTGSMDLWIHNQQGSIFP